MNVESESGGVRRQVVEAVAAAADLMAGDEVAARWDEPSALNGMTIGALSAHLVRAAGATLAYLDRSDPDAAPEGELLTPITYFHAAVDSPIHEQIKQVSAQEASAGHIDVVAECRRVASELEERLPTEPSDRLIGALGGRMLSLDDFCRTRLIEVLIHTDDLAASIGVETPATNPESSGEVIDILIGIARRLHGDWAVIHALARSERDDAGPVFPVM